MLDLDRPRLALYVVLAVAVCLLGARYLLARAPSSAPVGARATPDGLSAAPRADAAALSLGRADGGAVTVHVAGAVRRAGVYRLAAGSRVDDAIRRAGGPGRRADLAALNLAAKLEDGRQVLVPRRAAVVQASAGVVTGVGGAAGAPGLGGSGAAPAGPVNLNTATLEQLDTLDGVGPAIAQRILEYRQQHGGFRRVDELAEVPGIGDKRLAALTPLVSV